MSDEVKKVEPKGKAGGEWITFGTEQYRVAPLSFGAIRELQERIQALQSASGVPSGEQMDTIIDVAHAGLKRNYPDLTRDQVADMVDLSNYAEVLTRVLGMSGFKPAAEEPQGEALASTGTSSTSP